MLKSKIFKLLVYPFIFLWCLPQQLLAIIFRLFVKVEYAEKCTDVVVYKTNLKCGSITLGNKIFLCKSHWDNPKIVDHEYGHYRQNLILGWIYLIVIGLPSLIWAACFSIYRKKHNVDYDWFYTESWANKLGGLK